MSKAHPVWRRAAAAALLACLALATACSSGEDERAGTEDGAADAGEGPDAGAVEPAEAELPAGYEGYESELYADDANWLCRPDAPDDVCAGDLDATAVAADGSTEVVRHEVAEDPPADCFYVYPTISSDPTPNSDLEPDGERGVTLVQAARLTSACRVFAPLYRQVTLGMIGPDRPEAPMGVDPRQVAYDDVVDAFRHFVANDSDGRGFVLVGHSQGAGHLTRLIAEEIDGESVLRDRLIGAYLIGTSVAVPRGEVVGGDFQNVPLCEADDQVGCVVTYASFRSTAPPPADSFFGRTRDGEGVAGCVNPASPGGGRATLHPYLPGEPAFADPARNGEVTTPFVTFPDLVHAECVDEGGFSYLSITVDGDPADPRTDDIGGDLSPQWGLHLVDVQVAMGDVVEMAGSQIAAYVG
jgi:Protein of unknown function (DUF3089)